MSIIDTNDPVPMLHYCSLMIYVVKEAFQQQVVPVKTVTSTSDGDAILTTLII